MYSYPWFGCTAPSQHLMMTIRIRTLTREASEGRDPSSTTSVAFYTEKGLSPIVGAWVSGICAFAILSDCKYEPDFCINFAGEYRCY